MDKSPSYKNIVIVGGLSGIYGVHYLRNTLPKDYRIILIDRQVELFFPIASLKAAVVPGWEDCVHTPFLNIFKDERHIALPGTTVLELKERSLCIDKEFPEFELGSEIPFEYAILAVGASQSLPARAAGRTGEEIDQYLRAAQQSIASSSSVLVIGGGPAGIEFATEVKEMHPNVGVTLVQRSDRLARGAPGVHEKVLPVLQRMGIEVVLSDKVILPAGFVPGQPGQAEQTFRTEGGKEITAGYVYDATGNRPNNDLVYAVDPDAVAKNGCIKVKPTFEIDSPMLQYYFAMGDVVDVPEIKLLSASQRHGRTIAANILSLISGKAPTKHHTPAARSSSITLGSHNAVIYSPLFTFTGWLPTLLLDKDLHTGKWLSFYRSGKENA